MGQIVNPSTIPRMARANGGKRLIIVGGTNNQIDEGAAERRLRVC